MFPVAEFWNLQAEDCTVRLVQFEVEENETIG
jgi:hypothetical protein